MDALSGPRQLGEATVTNVAVAAREAARRNVRRALGVRGQPPAICDDPERAYLPVDGAARTIHADLPSMLIGGVASLLLQMLHPETMTGVAQHSRYREDPLGRLSRTAQFVGTTTFGSHEQARVAVERVRRVHDGVRGTTSDGVDYAANDSALLEWVHVAELSMFLAAARAYGPADVEPLADRYVTEMATVARDLGVVDPPTTAAELARRLDGFRPQLRLIDEGRDARNFVLWGPSRSPVQRAAYTTIVLAAVGILPGWAARALHLVQLPLANQLVVRPAATAMVVSLRLAVRAR